MIERGDPAPDFELPDQHGETVRLSDLRGRTVVLYFYPKADTPGCTAQACGVRDRRADYERANAVVLGVSPDPVGRIKRFADKHDLGFTLLADSDHSVAEAYGVWVEKKMYGRKSMGIKRSTFLIDSQGKVAKAMLGVKPEGHAEQVLEGLA